MYEFKYHSPASLKDAETLLGERQGAWLLAGGHTLLPTLKLRLAQPTDLIDLAGIDGLKDITDGGDSITIGAMTTHATVAESGIVAARIPALAQLAGGIGDQQVRHRGTIGGSVANNDPSADYPASCLGLGALIQTNRRQIAADDYFAGLFQTALEPGEILTAVSFPVPRRAAYIKYPNPASRYALVGAFVAQTTQGVRVAITGAGNAGVYRETAIEAALSNNFSPDAVNESEMDEDHLISDLHASAEYRRHLIAVMIRRGVAAALG